MIDRKILEFVESLNKEQKEELIKNLRNEEKYLSFKEDYIDCEKLFSNMDNRAIMLEVNNGLTINELVEKAHDNAVRKGFWYQKQYILRKIKDNKDQLQVEIAFINEFLTLISSEVFEAQAELRKGNKEAFNEEIADIFIRAADLVGGLGIDIEEEIKKKMEKNKGREKMHGKLF